MLNVLRKYPDHVRSLILDSPLPLSVNIDEDELANFNEALHQIFAQNSSDSGLEERFKNYLLSIKNTVFTTDYADTINRKTFKINYGRNELLDIVSGKINDDDGRKALPQLVNDLIKGNHKAYIDAYLGNVLTDNSAYSGMRLSVYCSDKMAYADQTIVQQQYKVHPQMLGYKANDVSFDMCKCWNVPPITPDNKKSFYSSVPILLGAGSFDPACRPVYNDLLHHYYPQSQRLLFTTKAHGVLLSLEGNSLIAAFLNAPFKRLTTGSEEIKNY